MTTTQDIRPGDALAVAERNRGIDNWPKISRSFYTASHPSANQAIAPGEYGKIYALLKDICVASKVRTRVAISTEKMQAERMGQAAELARLHAAYKATADLIGRELRQLKLTTEQLEALAKAWVEIKAMAQDAKD